MKKHRQASVAGGSFRHLLIGSQGLKYFNVRTVALAGAISLATLFAGACSKQQQKQTNIQTAAIERRDIVVEVEATGIIEPINVVEVKSKSSGQIVRMPVETGSLVKSNDLLVQLDTRDVKNQYDQALADVRAAQAKLDVSAAQRKRSESLWEQRVITAQEHEAASLDYANSQAQVVRARTNLDLAQQRLEDATVRAPVAGTVIEKTVSLGQVIASGTSAQGGGTTILKMADLNSVRARVLVTETDIGQVLPGQTARVTVDAYPERRFIGVVEKIEPQAVVQQSVTMFPVLVTLSNREGLLKPGMNGEVAVLVESRENVLAVPNDAVRNPRDAVAVADLLGVSPDTIRARMQAAMAGRGGRGGPGGAGSTRTVTSPGSVADGELRSRQQTGGQGGQGGQGRMQLPEVTDQQCAGVTAAFTKNPAARTTLDAIREQMRAGDIDRSAARDQSNAVYASLKVDPLVGRACQFRESRRGGEAGAGGQGNTGSAPAGGQQVQAGQRGTGTPSVGTRRDDPMAQSGGAPGMSRGRGRSAMVFVGDSGKWEPRMIMVGVSNYDYTEVLSGAKEGEKVALLAAAAMAAQRQQQTDRMRSMTGGAVPGMQTQPPRGGGGGGQRP